MATLLKQTTVIAKKEYFCDSSRFIEQSGNLRHFTFTFSEWRAIINARNNNWKILKGQKYIRQKIVDYGNFYELKMIPEIHNICIKYDYYQNN